MTHTEGVLKKAELVAKEEGTSFIYIEFVPFGRGISEKIAIEAQPFLNKVLLNTKIGLIQWEDEKSEDTVEIRGVGKDIPLFATYS